MAGFDNGTVHGGLFAQTKQFGAILRGLGPPAPQAGLLGDVYIDTQTWFLYCRREQESTDPWGGYLWQVPVAYQSTLKWFSTYVPDKSIGVDGDYCLLWGGFNNYGVQPSIFGPKASGYWPESGDGPQYLLSPTYAGYTLPAGVSDEGTPIIFSTSTQLVVAGLADDEYILAIPVAQLPNNPVCSDGLLSTPVNVAVNLNPLYSAEDRHNV